MIFIALFNHLPFDLGEIHMHEPRRACKSRLTLDAACERNPFLWQLWLSCIVCNQNTDRMSCEVRSSPTDLTSCDVGSVELNLVSHQIKSDLPDITWHCVRPSPT